MQKGKKRGGPTVPHYPSRELGKLGCEGGQILAASSSQKVSHARTAGCHLVDNNLFLRADPKNLKNLQRVFP